MHRATADRLGPRAALRWKRLGVWHDLAWGDYRRQADAVAAAIVDLNIRKGDRVGLLSENRPEWLVADVGLLTAGAADVPLHAPLAAPQVLYQLGHSGARGVIVSDQAQADKVFASLEGLPDLEWLAAFDPIRPPDGCRLRLLTWDGLIARGRLAEEATLAEARRRESSLGPDDLATILYTSGTTGPPKGVMLTHGNLLSNAEATIQAMPGGPEDILLSWLPYSHIYARTVDHYMTALGGGTVALAESVDTLVVNLAEVRPHWMTAVPRFYEKVWASVESLPPDARAAALHRIFGPRLRFLSSGGAPLPPHLARGFEEAGIPLLQGYGLSESSPVITFNRLDHHKIGTVGPPIPGVEVRIAPDGEILTRGPHVMKGYWRDPEATARTVLDGWLHTGDVGTLDADGFLTITDRKKDILVTSQGKNVAPAEIERLLTADPFIDQAVVCGDRRPFVAAILVPNFPALQARARELGCPWESDGEFLTSEPLRAFLAGRVEAAMQAVSQPERVRAFLVLARPFSPAEEEMTATLKVRRRHILAKFAPQLEALYACPSS
jgi:long-chain acyl-CoA synthetase